jgi:hypothetical protein
MIDEKGILKLNDGDLVLITGGAKKNPLTIFICMLGNQLGGIKVPPSTKISELKNRILKKLDCLIAGEDVKVNLTFNSQILIEGQTVEACGIKNNDTIYVIEAR